MSGNEWKAESCLQADMAEANELAIGSGKVCLFCHRSPRKSTPNEDAIAVFSPDANSVVLVVADGMGGGAAGERASALAIESIQESLFGRKEDPDVQLRTAILNGIEIANRKICEMGLGAGTTLAVVEVQGTKARPYHVGDSLILLVSNRGRIKFQSVSHSPVGYGIEAGLLDEHDAMHHEDRHLISNVVGIPEMRIEVGAPIEVAARDTLLLASDGLADNLSVEEISERIRKGNLKKGLQGLVDTAQQRMQNPVEGIPSKPDDLGVLAYRRGRT